MGTDTFLISRTDSIGDVVLTLPLCAWIKEQFPKSKILFLGRTYTAPILKRYEAIDEVINWDEIQAKPLEEQISFFKEWKINTCIHVFPNKEVARVIKKAGIQNRIGTSHRLFHWTTCNIRPNFTRKNSNFHESQLNFELLRPIGLKELPTKEQLLKWSKFFHSREVKNELLLEYLKIEGKKVILHPKSQGSAVEWPMENYVQLAKELIKEDYTVFFSGTEKEGLSFREYLPTHPKIIDLSGKSSLDDFIAFIAQVDVLVACSTGPLHIAAISGKSAIGLYTDLRPMHPGRWAPIGKFAKALTIGNQNNPQLKDIEKIEVSTVLNEIINN